MEKLIEGGKFWKRSGVAEGVYFDASPSGYTLVYNFLDPTAEEIASVSQGSQFEIRYIVVDGLLIILSKAGSLSWTDAPFAPQLCAGVKDLIRPEKGTEGTALTLLLVDARTNKICRLRMIGLGHDFSCKLYETIQEIYANPFNQLEYDVKLSRIFAWKPTKELVAQAEARYKLKSGGDDED